MIDRKNIETLVGLGVIVFCLALILMVYKNGFFASNKSSYTLRAQFDNVDGISIGSDVAVAGVKVGEVISKSVDSQNYRAVIVMTVDDDLKLPTDTSAEIVTMGFLGDKYISLSPGGESEFLKNGSTIEYTQSSLSIESLISKFVFSSDSNKPDRD